jgi:nucleoid DNA-binding protein
METVTQAQLLRGTLDIMEDDLRITSKQANDFVSSLRAVVEEQVEFGNKVNLLGLGIFTPVGVLAKPKRKGVKPQTGEEVVYPAKPASVKLKFGIAKRVREALPATTSSAGKSLLSTAKQRAEAAAERRAKREEEEAKAARKAERDAKKAAGGKKK